MTVAELIAQLEDCDQDLPVVVEIGTHGKTIEIKAVGWSDKDQVALEIE